MTDKILFFGGHFKNIKIPCIIKNKGFLNSITVVLYLIIITKQLLPPCIDYLWRSIRPGYLHNPVVILCASLS